MTYNESLFIFYANAADRIDRSWPTNVLRAHLNELGIIAATGIAKHAQLISIVHDQADVRLPDVARFALKALVGQIEALSGELKKPERGIVAAAKHDPDIQRLTTIPA